MNEQIIINNKNIADYVMFKLDKLENTFNNYELAKINELTLEDIQNNNILPFDDILLFQNLNSLNIKNYYIYNDDYNYLLKLTKLENISFENCEFENANLIASLQLKSLSLINCKINNYSFISILKTLEQLSLINGTIDINTINTLINLNYLQLSYSKILDPNTNINLQKLKELYIDNTNIIDLTFINNLNSLKRLSIDENQFKTNRILIHNIIAKNIIVLNENMTEFGDGNNG